MFGFQKYLDKLHNLKWQFESSEMSKLEELLYVKFEQQNDYFLIKEIYYSYVDILLGLEQVDFVMSKKGDEVKITIL